MLGEEEHEDLRLRQLTFDAKSEAAETASTTGGGRMRRPLAVVLMQLYLCWGRGSHDGQTKVERAATPGQAS